MAADSFRHHASIHTQFVFVYPLHRFDINLRTAAALGAMVGVVILLVIIDLFSNRLREKLV